MDQATKKALQIYAAKIRLGIVDSTNSAKSGHPGGSLSSADVFAYLYGKEMRVFCLRVIAPPVCTAPWHTRAFSRRRT